MGLREMEQRVGSWEMGIWIAELTLRAEEEAEAIEAARAEAAQKGGR